MKYTIDKHDRYVVIEPLTEVLDAEKAAKLKGEFLLRNTIGQRNIVLDLSNVKVVDEAGVRTGLLAHRLCQAVGGVFVVVNVTTDIMEVFEISQSHQRLTILNSLKDAEDLIFAHELEQDLRRKA